MYSLPGMQRSGYDEKNLLKALLLFGALLLYEPLTTQVIWLPPLFGLVVWGVYKGTGVTKALWLLYLYLYQSDHGLDFFVLFLTLFLTIKALDLIAKLLACTFCLKFVEVVIYYAFLLTAFWALQALFMHTHTFSYWLIGFYMILDLLAVAFYEA